MKGEYPNLPLIEERFKNLPMVKEANEVLETRAKEKGDWFIPQYGCDVFSQSFPNTAGIFEDGGFSGQAFINMYITVFHEYETKIYAVFGGNRPAYTLINPPEEFFYDLQSRHLPTVKEARERYMGDEDEEGETDNGTDLTEME